MLELFLIYMRVGYNHLWQPVFYFKKAVIFMGERNVPEMVNFYSDFKKNITVTAKISFIKYFSEKMRIMY